MGGKMRGASLRRAAAPRTIRFRGASGSRSATARADRGGPYQRSPGTTHLFGSPLCSAVIVAITGTPGTGKSSICSVLGRRGYFIVDLDQEARAGGCIVDRAVSTRRGGVSGGGL